MSKKILNYFVSMMMLVVFVIPLFTQAQANPGPGAVVNNPTFNIVIKNPFNCGAAQNCTLYNFITTIINTIVIPIGGVVAVFMIMYAGFLFVTARGNTAQIDKAKQALLWAVIGAAILLGASVIANAIGSTITQLKVP